MYACEGGDITFIKYIKCNQYTKSQNFQKS